MEPTFEEVYPVLYKGWNETAARADYNAGGWRNKAGVEQFLGGGQALLPDDRADTSILQSYQALISETRQKLREFDKNNPFNVW